MVQYKKTCSKVPLNVWYSTTEHVVWIHEPADPEEVVFNWDLFPSNMIKYSTSVVKIDSVFDNFFVYTHTHSVCFIKQST